MRVGVFTALLSLPWDAVLADLKSLSPAEANNHGEERKEVTEMMMNPASISALAAIVGSIVGALGSGASTWVTQRLQERREFLNKKFAQREQLYSDFISETAKPCSMLLNTAFRIPAS